MLMPVSYTFKNNIYSTNAEGLVTSEEIIEHYKSMLSHEREEGSVIEIVSLMKISDLQIKFSDIDILETLSKDLKARGHISSIIFAPSPDSRKIMDYMKPIFQRMHFSSQVAETLDYAMETASIILKS